MELLCGNKQQNGDKEKIMRFKFFLYLNYIDFMIGYSRDGLGEVYKSLVYFFMNKKLKYLLSILKQKTIIIFFKIKRFIFKTMKSTIFPEKFKSWKGSR